jgi:tetratricopeptide (TPR) repeat protein
MKYYLFIFLFLSSCTTINSRGILYSKQFQEKGSLSLNNGFFKLAKSQFQISLKYNPRNPLSYLGLGIIYYRSGDFKTAKRMFSKSLFHNPDLIEAYSNIGVIELQEKNYKKGIYYFEKALFLNPGYESARYNLGLTYLAIGKNKKSHENFLLLVATNPSNLKYWLLLAYVKALNGNFSDVKTILKKTKSLKDKHSLTLKYIISGILCRNRGNLNRAITIFEKGIEFNKGNVELNFQIALTYFHMKNLNKVKVYFNKVKAIHKDYPGIKLLKILLSRVN